MFVRVLEKLELLIERLSVPALTALGGTLSGPSSSSVTDDQLLNNLDAYYQQKYGREATEAERQQVLAEWGTRLPSFANEGMVSRPTLAMIGDANEPEYVLHKSTVDGLRARASAGGNGLTVNVNLSGTLIGNSREFEDAVTSGTLSGLERGGKSLGKMRTIVKQMVA
jgi:hypothetical protein